MSTTFTPPAPGTYRFSAPNVDQAVTLVRNRLGPNASVVSVKTVAAKGFKRLFVQPRLEIVAEVKAPGHRTDLAEALKEGPIPKPESSARPSPNAKGSDKLGLSNLLMRSGISESAMARLEASPKWPEISLMPLHRALAEASSLLAGFASNIKKSPLSRAAFIGTSGSGRSTALAKAITFEAIETGAKGQVVSIDFERPAHHGQLSAYCEALGVPWARFSGPTEAPQPKGFVYFDTPPLSISNKASNKVLADILSKEKIDQRVLVLNAAYDRSMLRTSYAIGRDLGATHLVFTHLDEVAQCGKLWDFMFEDALEPLFLSTGPSLSGEFDPDVLGSLVRRTLPVSS